MGNHLKTIQPAVAQEHPDDQQHLVERQGPRGVRMPEVMKSRARPS